MTLLDPSPKMPGEILQQPILKKQAPVLSLEKYKGESLNVYMPTWDNRPEDMPAILTLRDLSILSHQNITSIIASPGIGKSSICEAALSSLLNPNVDCLGFKISEGCTGAIYIDFERTNLDVWNSFYRMCNRAGVQKGETLKTVKIAGMRAIPRLTERLEEIDRLLQDNPCSLLVLDGAGDLVTDTNDLLQAIECRIFLRELTVKYNLSILTTLHPNPNTNKPRGHIGSEILRESECVLLARKGEGDCRVITSDFEHGKNRNNAPITVGFEWSDARKMFVSAEIETKIVSSANAKKKDLENIAKEIFSTFQSRTNSEIVKAIEKYRDVSESTAKRKVKDMLELNIITKRIDGNYILNTL